MLFYKRKDWSRIINYSKFKNMNTYKTKLKNKVPIIAIDGHTASGKGTIANMLAKHFGFNYLNSGALYRIAAHEIKNKNVDINDHDTIAKIGASLAPIFVDDKVILKTIDPETKVEIEKDIWPEIKGEEHGHFTSKISPIKKLRDSLHECQRNQIKGDGLVAEGRDMTGGVFPDAHVKIFLTANIKERARRRHENEKHKKEKDPNHNLKSIEEIEDMIEKRDYSDANREHGKVVIVDDAHVVDSTNMNLEETFEYCKNICEKILKEKDTHI